MPLTKAGYDVLRAMKDKYGDKRGKEVFYSSINKGVKGSEKWHEKRKKNDYSDALKGQNRAQSTALAAAWNGPPSSALSLKTRFWLFLWMVELTMRKIKDWKDRVLEKKWKQLEKQGLTRPKDYDENKRRAKAAHGYQRGING